MDKRFDEMTGPEQVRAYNEMETRLAGLQERTPKLVQRFATTTVGARRCEQAASSIRAAEASARAVAIESDRAMMDRETAVAQKQAAPLADRIDAGTATPTEQAEVAEEQEAERAAGESSPSEIEEDEVAKRKRAAAVKRKAKRAANGAGPTLRELTEEFNGLVPRAKKAGLGWAKHHTSLFESRATAEKQLARLKKELR